MSSEDRKRLGIAKQKSEKHIKKICSHPHAGSTCQGKIIRAHTVPRSGSLKKIANMDGLVYTYQADIMNFGDKSVKAPPPPVLTPISKASTFTGFCKKHDNEMFLPLEDKDFIFSPEQFFLLSYRALSRGLYSKTYQYDVRPRSIFNQSEIPASATNYLDRYEKGVDLGRADLLRTKDMYDNHFISNDFSKMKHYCMITSKTPPVMCSGDIFPVADFSGKELQDLSDINLNPESIQFTSMSIGECGLLCFSWLNNTPSTNGPCEKFIQSLHEIGQGKKDQTILNFIISSFENIFISPAWWDSIGERHKRRISKRFWDLMPVSEDHFLTKHTFLGLDCVDWNITEVRSNVDGCI